MVLDISYTLRGGVSREIEFKFIVFTIGAITVVGVGVGD